MCFLYFYKTNFLSDFLQKIFFHFSKAQFLEVKLKLYIIFEMLNLEMQEQNRTVIICEVSVVNYLTT